MKSSHILIMLLVALTSNLDNLGVGISYGTRKIYIPFASNLLIAFITGIGTLFSILAGEMISGFLNPRMANYLGSSIIAIVGVWILIKELTGNAGKEYTHEQQKAVKIEMTKYSFWGKLSKILENPFIADMDFSGNISIKEGFILGWALAVNNMANGIGAGMAGINPALTAFFAFLFSLLAIWTGIKAGYGYFSRWLGNLAGPTAGLLLIVIGIYEIFA